MPTALAPARLNLTLDEWARLWPAFALALSSGDGKGFDYLKEYRNGEYTL